MRPPARWQRGCAVALAACLLGLLVACPVGVAGVQQGAVKPAWFDYGVGPLRLVGYSTWNANCPPYIGCDPTLHESYVVWVVLARPGAGEQAHRFVRVPIQHGPQER